MSPLKPGASRGLSKGDNKAIGLVAVNLYVKKKRYARGQLAGAIGCGCKNSTLRAQARY